MTIKLKQSALQIPLQCRPKYVHTRARFEGIEELAPK